MERKLLQAGRHRIRGRGKGSHGKFRHPEKPGAITVPWHQGRDLPVGIFISILKQAGIDRDDEKKNGEKTANVLEYVMVIEKEGEVYWAHFPDLPGCFTDGETLEELHKNAREAVDLHIESLRESGQPLPEPGTRTAKVAVKAS